MRRRDVGNELEGSMGRRSVWLRGNGKGNMIWVMGRLRGVRKGVEEVMTLMMD
jgi:hypothetical protein